jgi:predicted Abi (CAAX) family protease
MFPSRWKIAVLSNWNRAKRLGRLTQISLGPVGHQVPGGMLDPNARLPDGRTNLRQTLDYIESILADRLVALDPGLKKKISNYDRYVRAEWNRPEYYPLAVAPANRQRYHPVADWIGRLILPERDARFGGAWLEIHHAPPAFAQLAGTRAKLVWNESAPGVRELLRAVRRDVAFSAEANYTSTYGGLVHPVRVNRWRLVDPLESLAGSHPIDDVIVKLAGAVGVEESEGVRSLRIERQPVQITGAQTRAAMRSR